MVLPLAILIFFNYTQSSFGQDTNPPNQPTTKLTLLFSNQEIELENGTVLSNVAKVINNSKTDIIFSLDLFFPGDWRLLGSTDKWYEIAPKDTIFIPVRLIPSKSFEGNTKVSINGLLLDKNGLLITDNSFFAYSQKQVSWALEVYPGERVYFKNDVKSSSFDVEITNTGNYEQEVLFNITNLKGDLLIKDSSDNILKKNFQTLKLKKDHDTLFKFNVEIKEGLRNFRTLSIETHRPNLNLRERISTLFMSTTEPKITKGKGFTSARKINFVQLPNERKYSDYSGSVLPLTVEANIQNLLGNGALLNLMMRGRKDLEDGAQLIYNTQLNFNSTYFNPQLLENTPWYVGYFNDSISVQVGNISGGTAGINSSGKGIKGSYRFMNDHKAGLFYVQSPRLLKVINNQSYGGHYSWTPQAKIKLSTNFGHNTNHLAKTKTNAINLGASYRIAKTHSVRLQGGYSNLSNSLNPINPFKLDGFFAGLGYGSTLLERKLSLNYFSRYTSKHFGGSGTEKVNLSGKTNYIINSKWIVYWSTTYFLAKQFEKIPNGSLLSKMVLFNNNVVFSTPLGKGSLQPSLYYDFTDQYGSRLHSRGVGMRYSFFNYNKNIMFSNFFKGGYNWAVEYTNLKNYFNLSWNAILKINTLTLNAFYKYGPTSVMFLNNMIKENIIPQMFRFSLNHQYQFKNNHFILQTSSNYYYHNRTKSHSFNFHPELFYFTDGGWRFSVNMSYTYNSSNFSGLVDINNIIRSETEDTAPRVSQGMQFGVSIKKNFGIPIPGMKKSSTNAQIVAFFDVNGNGIWEKQEETIENVIVRVNNREVITNQDGISNLLNIPIDKYSLMSFTLETIDGWFPNNPDSITLTPNQMIHIPFVKGVKVYGNVALERQKIAIMNEKVFDLGNIRISATSENGKVYETLTSFDGSFELFIPNGKYTLTMNENILGSKYSLTRNNFTLELDNDIEKIYTSFYIIEKKRKIKMKKFNSNTDTLNKKTNSGKN